MLQNRKIIVTGAAAGIGKEVVQQCIKEGATVIACDINQEGLDDLKQTINHRNRLFIYRLDVSSYEAVSAFFHYLEKEHPRLDGLVNNAGIYLAKNIADYQVDEINKVLDVNVKGGIYFSQMFGEKLLQAKYSGVIVNMSSVAGMEGSSDAIYGASKAAILGLTKSCAMNFSPYIRVNTVAPTMVDTSMMEIIPSWRREEYLNNELIDTPVTAKDVAETVVFLLSDKSKHYTGATFDLNNGGYLR
ncbi:SDR family NAD(P)-dependent oxidoreductase [Oceanobacillus sp. J11TS1]|uniref:SDR family NAD(P)-dependent oxidoreductase n=1 Tax=Oceanobacillus sp. J11TS1 TaxID=2807191 RepID=UPI001B2D16ED|nr:SDR family oxidoreductase [Oceanobacillus sp. J11TS1]GIO25199.1 3-oxoacyl-[acyl-carrier-protein] reductase FabG [Oceanobacillus sp. J11TS1]